MIGSGDLDGVEVVEDVQLGQVHGCVVVHVVRVTDDNQVEPTAAALAAGGDTKLAANDLQLLAVGVQLLRGERTAANARGVGLDDANDLTY